MKQERPKGNTRGNILFVLTIFIIFLLVFERQLVVPAWLQPVGRMHAMILHFPIVVIFLAVVLELFRFGNDPKSQSFYREILRNMLFAGVILAGITVIMGIFLSREEGYDGEILLRHKWTGVGLYFLTLLLSGLRDASWFNSSIRKAGAVAMTLLLILAGHFGAEITHGENFVWQPVSSASAPESVTLEDALVFDHVVLSVFENKCVSCHNADKRKGRLLLTDTASILKGGKTGKLLVSGRPDESLLIERITLPADDKKHMPPSGKPQLTEDELRLLQLWISSGASFNARVQSLPETDSLRLMATKVLEAIGEEESRYTFAAVAQQTLDELNSNYRVIRPVSLNSPALAVNIYNRSAYAPQTLDELKKVKFQVVSLDLSKMPVTDNDLKYIARFENLERLNLNFTGITGEGLSTLAGLSHLESLSLSGTGVRYTDLKKALPRFTKLKNLSVWETALSLEEIKGLQETFRHINVLGISGSPETLIKLNPPRLKNKARVFDESVALELFHPVNGVEIRFTTDGSDPDSVSSALYKGNTKVAKTTSVKARAFKGGWLSSDVATLPVYRCSLKPDTAILLTKMNRVHTANGAMTFFDHELGSFNANSPAWANNWGGFIRNDMELMLQYDHPTQVSSVSLNTLIETETSIFPPESVEIWGGPSAENLKLLSRTTIDLPAVYRKPYIELLHFDFVGSEVSVLKIVAKPVMKLPLWHKNKEKPALMLIDEILVN